MKVSNHPHAKIRSKLSAFISFSAIRQLAEASEFCVRAARKIDPVSFVLSFFLCCTSRKTTLSNCAAKICLINGSVAKENIPYKQAICKRLTDACSLFAEALLTKLLCSRLYTEIKKKAAGKTKDKPKSEGGVFRFFTAVLVQDSTTIGLPDALSDFFKGNVSRGLKKAVARIQCILDIKTMKFRHFQLGSFCENDQSAASLICHLVSKGSLVLRDLGYFVLRSFREIAEREGYYLSRIKYGLSFFDPGSGKALQLKSLLQSVKASTSIHVIVGQSERLPARLIIIPLDEKIAAERRRRARKNRDRRLNHSKEYMMALGYQIMLTNVEADMWTPQQAAEAYRLRWSIESIFKGFKSAGLHMDKFCGQIKTNGERARSTLLLTLCFIVMQVIIIHEFYSHILQQEPEEAKHKCKTDKSRIRAYLSVNKMLAWLCDNFLSWITAPPDLQMLYLRMFCCYDHRKDRTNMAQNIDLAFTLS